jgi:hypothetical protein
MTYKLNATVYAADAAGDEELRKYGEQREIDVLLDRELGLDGPAEVGNDVMAKASAVLRDRGIHPNDASQEQLLEALRQVSA